VFENNEVLAYSCDEPSWEIGQKPEQYLVLCLDAKWDAGLKSEGFSGAKIGYGLLVADTIVVMNGKVMGKPENKTQAIEMLKKLSGSQHEVWTGFKLGKLLGASSKGYRDFQSMTRIVKSQVEFRKLTNKEISDYVKSGEPMDKAGAYGFQGIGMQLVRSVKGSYTNIVGLPLIELKEVARRLDFA